MWRWAVLCSLVVSGACTSAAPDEPEEGIAYARTVEVLPRTPHITGAPCGEQCHDAREPDPTPRALTTFHAGRRVEHGPAIRFCDSCHALEDADQLRRMDGTHVSFDESDQICGQCHGDKHRDWEAGLHGTVTGGWRGAVFHRQCTACHDPHAPGPITFEALPTPLPDPRLRGGA